MSFWSFRSLARKKPDPIYHSKFGGLWIDRSDWKREARSRRVGKGDMRLLESFVKDGFVIFEGAASARDVDAFQAEIARSFREGNSDLLCQLPFVPGTRTLEKGVNRLGSRVLDSYMALPAALDLLASPRLLSFLTLIFGEPPMLFQSLSFDQGSQQGLHQDTAYVVVDRPLELAACWIALEDVQAGSGELMYAPGSHRYPDFDFGSGKKHYDQALPGDAHDRWAADLRARADVGGTSTFLAKKGDILVWHADLAHGGSPVADPALTRQSLVGHFCPASATPNYFRWRSQQSNIGRHGALTYCSEHYDALSVGSSA